MRLLTTVLLLAAAAPALAQTPNLSVETLKDVTKTLSSDEFGGRMPATPSEDKTIDYMIKRFQAAGLKPGNNGSWLQKVPVAEINSTPEVLSFANKRQKLNFSYKTDMVGVSYRLVPHTEVKNSDVVFVGFGVNAPERGWNDYAGLNVKGKTVIILINDPDYDDYSGKGKFEGRAMTYYGRWTYKFEEAARQGAAAAFIVHDTYPAAYPWGVVVSSWTGPQIRLDAANNHMDQTLVNGWITTDAATKLMAASGLKLEKLIKAAKKPGFVAVPLRKMKADIAFDNSIRRQASNNVIGILPGKTSPNEYVVYSAHWDHLGKCEPVKGDDICNGALDNATGSAGLVALAEAHAKAGPADRSLIFLSVTAEEQGLLGSAYYGANPVYPLAQTVGGINMDGLNVTGRTHDVTIIGPGKSELEPILDKYVRAQSRLVTPEATPEKGSYFRSDHFSLAKYGVPMIYFGSGENKLEGGTAAGHAMATDYITNRYHKPQDEYRADWDWSGAVEDLTLNYQIGRELATGTAWPNWYPSAEFRAIRDKSRLVPMVSAPAK